MRFSPWWLPPGDSGIQDSTPIIDQIEKLYTEPFDSTPILKRSRRSFQIDQDSCDEWATNGCFH